MSIGQHGKLEAIGRKTRTEKKLREIRKTIECEIDRNDGVYPYNHGKISQQEVLRRAGLSSAALQKKTHDALRNEINLWIRIVTQKSVTGARSVRRAVTDRVDAVKDEMKQLLQQCAETELDYSDVKAAMTVKDARIAELEQQLERLKTIGSGSLITFADISKRKNSRHPSVSASPDLP